MLKFPQTFENMSNHFFPFDNFTFTEASAQKAMSMEDEDSELDQKIGEWRGGGQQGSQIITRSPKSGNRMANVGKVKFQPPNVPVIFVLGGPGSGKVTHCGESSIVIEMLIKNFKNNLMRKLFRLTDTLMQEKRGVTHINMMDLLQQYAIGNGEMKCQYVTF